jgi:hypothetical protein
MAKLTIPLRDRLIVGPSDTHGGWWLRVLLKQAVSRKGDAFAILLVGWGFDSETPLRPWPTFHVERRQDRQLLAWTAWFGFMMAMQGQTLT